MGSEEGHRRSAPDEGEDARCREPLEPPRAIRTPLDIGEGNVQRDGGHEGEVLDVGLGRRGEAGPGESANLDRSWANVGAPCWPAAAGDIGYPIQLVLSRY